MTKTTTVTPKLPNQQSATPTAETSVEVSAEDFSASLFEDGSGTGSADERAPEITSPSSASGSNKEVPDDNDQGGKTEQCGCGRKWSAAIHWIRYWVVRGMKVITYYAATWPRVTLLVTSGLSIALLLIGFFTNFRLELNNANLWPPRDSVIDEQFNWYINNAHFNYEPVDIDIFVHLDGDNVLGKQGVERVFEAIETVTEISGYKEGCAWAQQYGNSYWVGQCSITSVADFWNEDRALFEQVVHTDQDAIAYMSQYRYPSGIIVDTEVILGNAEMRLEFAGNNESNTTTSINQHPTNDIMALPTNVTAAALHLGSDGSTTLISAQSYRIVFGIPWSNVTLDFETKAVHKLLQLRKQWDADPNNPFRLEVSSYSSYSNEFLRAILMDLPLMPAAGVLMCGFTLLVFAKCHCVYSRGLLGIGAVLCIVGSVMTSFGIMFWAGVPFTTQTVMLPFLMLGIGLDDAFIIFGSYNRKDSKMDVVERIQLTMDDIGMSIFLTSITSALAFGLGANSRIPCVSWLCIYAIVAIIADYLYQITFFISVLVLDERRIQANRMDWITCIKRQPTTATSEDQSNVSSGVASPADQQPQLNGDDGQEQTQPTSNGDEEQQTTKISHNQSIVPDGARFVESYDSYNETHAADRFMAWFATKLLKPKIQAFVIVIFCVILGGSIYSATQLHQQFDFTQLVPKDSFLKGYFHAWKDYSNVGLYTMGIFRFVDQSDPSIQDQMEQYVNDLVKEGPVDEPTYFWLRDFKAFLEENNSNTTLMEKPFDEQVNAFLDIPIYYQLYNGDIGQPSGGGHVFESRVKLHVNVDLTNSKDATHMLETLRAISRSEPINQGGQGNWPFFTYNDQYQIYEFYIEVINELIFNTVMSVVAVNIISLLFIPHWTATLFTAPFIIFLYVEMLGYLYLSGVEVNAISYVVLVMSIGLMVDYIMHILLRYFEASGTRAEKVKDSLSTLGASMLLGGISTFLGILMLAFSTSEILHSVFVSVIGLIILGILNGLVFLPVALALMGPT